MREYVNVLPAVVVVVVPPAHVNVHLVLCGNDSF